VTSAFCYVGNPEWSAAYEQGFLILSGGADHLYAIEDVPQETADELAALWERPAEPVRLSSGAARLAPQLLNVGALLREIGSGPPADVAVIFSGHEDDSLLAAMATEAETRRRWALAGPAEAELTLVVRTGGRLAETSDGIDHPVAGPHLLLDVAFHHTISLGPLVFPGETACLACLAGRIGQYWADPAPPAKPAIQRETRLIAGVAALELDKIAAGDYGLVNATVALDLRRHDVKRHALYKLPWCPVCADDRRGETIGPIELPWAAAA
jgi:bacteriocin biosynthesis cyclodehydratase domain-containing protein